MGATLSSALLVPEIVHPAQFFDAILEKSGERGLMCAVLERAVADYVSDKPYHQYHRQQARAFVASDDRIWPYSFLNLCEAVGLHPHAVRRALRDGRPEEIRLLLGVGPR